MKKDYYKKYMLLFHELIHVPVWRNK